MLKLFRFITYSLALYGLSACSSMDRSAQSGYYNTDRGPSAAQEFYRSRQQQAWTDAREELGLKYSKELSEEDTARIQARVELSRLERKLNNAVEKKQYYSLKPYFKNDFDRINFLKLPNREAKTRWAAAKGISTEESHFTTDVNYLIENNDIARGMSKTAVKQSWGEPDFVEVAGNPLYGNERWKFNKLVSTDDGYKPETRIIYFESGRVVGWESLQ